MPPGELAPSAEAVAVTSLLGEGSLLDAVDRLLDVGAVAAGEATISVAGVDLIYLGLHVVLSSVETLRRAAGEPGPDVRGTGAAGPTPGAPGGLGEATTGQGRPASIVSSQPAAPDHIDIAPETAEQGLAKLVLTLVEFVRQLLERQAVRRMEGGGLSEEEVERMGLALLRLREQLWLLAGQFRLRPEDLNVDLGPLGTLT